MLYKWVKLLLLPACFSACFNVYESRIKLPFPSEVQAVFGYVGPKIKIKPLTDLILFEEKIFILSKDLVKEFFILARSNGAYITRRDIKPILRSKLCFIDPKYKLAKAGEINMSLKNRLDKLSREYSRILERVSSQEKFAELIAVREFNSNLKTLVFVLKNQLQFLQNAKEELVSFRAEEEPTLPKDFNPDGLKNYEYLVLEFARSLTRDLDSFKSSIYSLKND